MAEDQLVSSGDEEQVTDPKDQDTSESTEQETTTPTAASPEQEWFEPGKFKTPEDMKKSYYDQGHRFTKLEQELSELKTKLQHPEVRSSAEDNPEVAEAKRFVREVVNEEIAELKRQQLMQRFQEELSVAKQSYPLAQDQVVKAMLIEHPSWTVAQATAEAHQAAETFKKQAIEDYVTDLDKKRSSGTGEKAGPTYTSGSKKPPKNFQEAMLHAAKRFEAE